jgi:hypothetical protein
MAKNPRGVLTTGDTTLAASANLTAKTAPIGADPVIIFNTESGNALQKTTFANAAKAISPTLAGVEATNGLTQASGVLTVAAKVAHMEAALLMGTVTALMSFETGEVGATKFYFPFACTINKIYGIVTKALAATDVGTIQGGTVGGSGGASSLMTFPLSSAVGAELSATPAVNATVLKDGYYSLTSAKTTAGGKVFVTINYTQTATV